MTLHAKGKENIVITDASEIGLCITVRKEQGDVDIEPNAYGKSHLNYNKLEFAVGELELLAVVWRLVFFNFTYTEKSTYKHGSSSRTVNETEPKLSSI